MQTIQLIRKRIREGRGSLGLHRTLRAANTLLSNIKLNHPRVWDKYQKNVMDTGQVKSKSARNSVDAPVTDY